MRKARFARDLGGSMRVSFGQSGYKIAPQLRKNPERANQPLMPLIGVRCFNLPGVST